MRVILSERKLTHLKTHKTVWIVQSIGGGLVLCSTKGEEGVWRGYDMETSGSW